MKTIFLFFIPIFFVHILAQPTVNEVIEKIKLEVKVPWQTNTVDNIKAGDGNTKVTGIATTFMATLAVLKQAKAAGCNFIITHEPTFYSHTDLLKTHENDPIQIEKLKYINDNGLVVFRFHDHQHTTKPDQIYAGFVSKIGWSDYEKDNFYTFKIPEKSLKNIVKEIENKFKAKTMRIVGNPSSRFSKVGLVLGAAGSDNHFMALQSTDIELLIVGESNEWETVPYIQDAVEMGKNKALIVMGHADSEEIGMEYCAKWLQGFYPDLKIKFIEAKNPYWRN